MRTSIELANEVGPLRVQRIEAFRVRIPMIEPFRISSGEVADKEAILVRLWDGDAFGWGESSSMAGGFYSAETPDSCQAELVDRVLPGIAGREFANMMELETHLAAATSSRFVRVAVETAAWELLARKRGQSLHQLFGIEPRPIPSGLAIGLYDTVDELWQAIERYRPRDYKRLKIKIKQGQDVALVARVRLLLDHFPLFVDANADYGRDSIPIFEKLDRYGLMMYEQPMAKDDLEGSAELQRRVETPVCLDESIECVQDARRAIALGSCRIVNIKLQRVGGFLEAIRIVEECVSHGIGLWMGTMPELGVGSAQALVLAAHPAFLLPTDVEPSKRWYVDDILAEPLRLACGHLAVPSGPGLGYTVDLDKVHAHEVGHWCFEP
jgi:O-succinylbenzoate synthase